jgi:ABC-type multidrug transport system fused ATPase/permease subunit
LKKDSLSSQTEEPHTSNSRNALVWRLLALSWRYRAGCIRVLGFQLLLLALTLSSLGLTGLGIDFVRFQLEPKAQHPRWPFHFTPPQTWTPLETVALISGTIVVVSLLRAILNYLTALSVAQLVQREILINLRTQVYDKLQRLSFRFFDENASGSIINRVTGDVQNVRMFVDGVMIQGVTVVISLIAYIFYMVNIHVQLTIACLATTPFLIAMVIRFSRLVRPALRRNRQLVDEMITTYSESIQGIQVIKGFAREKEADEKFKAANRLVKDQQQWIFHRVSTFGPNIGLLTQLNLTILMGYGGYLVFHGEMALGTGLFVFAGLLQQFSNQVQNIAQITNSIQQSLIGARRVFEILDAPLEIQNQSNPIQLKRAKGKIQFDKVSFAFDEEELVLKDIDFEIRPGQCVAILGVTGSGKSSIMSLIPRFYDTTKGRVLIDDVDVRDLDIDDLRRNIGLVFQENFLFSMTVGANIAFGHPDATAEQIQRAAKIAAAHEFIMELPNGYDTVLGEGGLNLSGGQRQRLAIARALLLEPSILLLDDPTAAIDSRTENEIFEAIDQAIEGRTTLIVAHRLSTLRRADLILVLRKGQIVQRGTHEELMKMKGPYQHVAMLQLVDQESLQLLTEISEEAKQ